jgi:predicted DCC family thiol-disulfide oxidoreductase YuxK
VKDEPVILLFDGVCNFCDGMVNFLIRQDKKNMLRFAALQSEAGERIMRQYGITALRPDSFILIQDGKVYSRSTAGLRLYNILPWYWKWTQLFWIVPRFIRDFLYDLVAKNRYKWFGKKDQCMVPTKDLRSRFLS